jgi:hypothetical protein
MPPRHKSQAGASSRGAPAQTPSLASLPPDVIEVIAKQLICQDQLNSPETTARNIASLAQVSK